MSNLERLKELTNQFDPDFTMLKESAKDKTDFKLPETEDEYKYLLFSWVIPSLISALDANGELVANMIECIPELKKDIPNYINYRSLSELVLNTPIDPDFVDFQEIMFGESSNIDKIGYCIDTEAFKVRFKTGSACYLYSKFTLLDLVKVKEVIDSGGSLGSYLFKALKNFEFTKLEEFMVCDPLEEITKEVDDLE